MFLEIYLFIYLLCIQCSAVLYAYRPKEGTRSHYGDCEPTCGCLKLNPGPLEKQSVLLTTEPSLQPLGSVLETQNQDTFRAERFLGPLVPAASKPKSLQTLFSSDSEVLCEYMFACMSVHYVCARCLRQPEEGIRPSGTGVTDGCEPSRRCGVWNQGPL